MAYSRAMCNLIGTNLYELIPVLYIASGLHPDHDSINTFMKRFLSELGELFVMLLQIAHDMKIFKLGDI